MRRVVGWRSTLPILIIGILALVQLPHSAQAGSLSTLRNYLNRQAASQTSGIVHQFFFTPATAHPGSTNTVALSFPAPQSTFWCRTAGADLSVSGITDPEGTTEGATALPGTLTGSCSQGNGSTTGDTLLISGVGSLNAGAKYGVSIAESGGTAVLGTPTAANNILVNVQTTDGTVDVDANFFWMAIVSNDRVTISAVVSSAPPPSSNPIVQFKGRASPSINVNFRRDSTLIQSVTAGTDAKFDVTLTDQPTGQHTYTVEATDAEGRAHTSATFALNLAAGSTTVISGVFLGPTIAVDKAAVKIGETVTIFGKTAPSSAMTVTVSSDPVSYNVVADANGDWSKAVDTDDIGEGSHSAVAMAVASDNTVSEESAAATFAVNPLEQCDGKSSADINCDGRVNLTDFSILLFYWLKQNPANPRADVNADGTVTIVDFSIMLYQWTN